MIHELVYTSAQSGLKTGSRGYCTVASSQGMSKPMGEKLESLSGYRHLFPPGTPDASRNPVCYSFLRSQIGGQQSFVLSRVADSGLDYSGRSNKLAHHIVFEQSDLVPPGPAACLADESFAISRWEGDPRVLPPFRVPDLIAPDERRQGWGRVAGDEEWCDYLVHLVRKRKPIYMIYPLGVDVLKLLVETQSLLSAQERWQMTFSTFFTRLPQGRTAWFDAFLTEPKKRQRFWQGMTN